MREKPFKRRPEIRKRENVRTFDENLVQQCLTSILRGLACQLKINRVISLIQKLKKINRNSKKMPWQGLQHQYLVRGLNFNKKGTNGTGCLGGVLSPQRGPGVESRKLSHFHCLKVSQMVSDSTLCTCHILEKGHNY